MKKSILYIATIASLFIASCSSNDGDVDNQKPEIVLLEPHDHEGFQPGSEIHIQGIITDNVALGSYKIEIHGADDNHTHARLSSANIQFTYEQTFTVDQNTQVIELDHEIQIPETINGLPIANGHYHVGIFALDKAGNQQQVFKEIYIGNDADEHNHG